jgi:hypothetical protein
VVAFEKLEKLLKLADSLEKSIATATDDESITFNRKTLEVIRQKIVDIRNKL